MKTAKITFQLLLVGLLSFLVTGCLTHATSREAFQSKTDWFEPTAIYKSQNGGDLIIEGRCRGWSSPAYLIVPAKVLVEAHKKSGGDVSFSQIADLPADIRSNLKLQKNLPAGYEKVADIPQGESGIQVNKQTQVNVGAAAKLPFAFVIDAAGFPIELLLIKASQGFEDVN